VGPQMFTCDHMEEGVGGGVPVCSREYDKIARFSFREQLDVSFRSLNQN